MLRWRICCIRPPRLNNNSREKVSQEKALPTLTQQVRGTSPRRKEKFQRVAMRKPLKSGM